MCARTKLHSPNHLLNAFIKVYIWYRAVHHGSSGIQICRRQVQGLPYAALSILKAAK